MKAVIFDMDGILIDSEPLHGRADLALLKRLGVSVEGGYLDKFVGVSDREMWHELIGEFNITLSVDEILEEQIEAKLQLLGESSLGAIDGIFDLITTLRKESIPMAVASSSSKRFIGAVLKKIAIDDFISVRISGEDVKISKPEPDIFLKAAETLGVSPEECIVIEDSKNGVIAAKRAGMCCIGYRNPNSGSQDLSQAQIIVGTIREITLTQMSRLHESFRGTI